MAKDKRTRKLCIRTWSLLLTAALWLGVATPSQAAMGGLAKTKSLNDCTVIPPAEPVLAVEPEAVSAWMIEGVPVIHQYPEFPTGCESVATVMALQYAGEDISPGDFIDGYLPQSQYFYWEEEKLYGPDPYEIFVGDPRSDASYGCMSPVIETALTAYFADEPQRFANTSGLGLEELCQMYVANDVPVIFWGTINMLELVYTQSWILPNGEEFTWPGREHCLVLVGYDEYYYYINDPYTGQTVSYEKWVVEARHESLGLQSIVIFPSNEKPENMKA